jgi:hypothetical protein
MKLYVKNTNAKMETFEIPETTTIFDLKEMYVQRLGTGERAEDIYLTLSGKILRNDFTIEEYAMENESILYCVYRVIPEVKK